MQHLPHRHDTGGRDDMDETTAAAGSVTALSAQASLLQPIHWLVMVVAGAVIGGMLTFARIERIERGLETLTTIVCSDKPQDSACQQARRDQR